jgi:hypothetical protein
MVSRGKFILYDAYLPALTAGRYQMRSDMDLFTTSTSTPDAETDVQSHVTHLNVTAPRYKLPPDQVLLTFPPANSEGAYESRLPQIVLKRRTLPWDRDAIDIPAGQQTTTVTPEGTTPGSSTDQTVYEETPWLALVVIAEGEGSIEHDVPTADCVSEGVTLTGDADTATASCLSVPRSTVRAVFPTVEDLIALTHVREVNLADTEAAMGDDDGFLAVVIANRMPQYDRENCKPKSYTACLINLEGQLDKLPPPAPPRKFFAEADLHISATSAAVAEAVHTGAAVPLTASTTRRRLDPNDGTALTDAMRRGEVVFHAGRLTDRAGVTGEGLNVLGTIDSGALLDGEFSALELTRGETAAAPAIMQVQGTFGGFNLPIGLLTAEPIYRFPVLSSWRFTCAGEGSFEKLMRNLDVGLLGAKTAGGYERQLPDCTPPETGTGPGDAPITKLPLEIAETGHVGVPHLTRTGSEEDAWYRGPFSPHRLMRRVLAKEGDDQPVLAHVSDHLRMMTPQGRQDVSLAVAFETGRLLAMSQPSFVASLMRWKSRAFGADLIRAKQLEVFVDDGIVPVIPRSQIEDAIARGFAEEVLEAAIFSDLARRREGAICPAAPLVTAGQPINALSGSVIDALSVGLGIETELLTRIIADPEAPEALAGLHTATPEVVGTTPLTEGPDLDKTLNAALDRGLVSLAELAIGRDALANETVDNVKDFDSFGDFLLDRFETRRGRER